MLLTVAVMGASAWATEWQRFTWGARFGTFGCALAVLVAGYLWQRHQPSTPPSNGDAGALLPVVNRKGEAVWLTVIVIAAVWDVLGLLTPPDQAHLTLSAIELDYPPLHGLLYASWLAIGWLLARQPLRR